MWRTWAAAATTRAVVRTAMRRGRADASRSGLEPRRPSAWRRTRRSGRRLAPRRGAWGLGAASGRGGWRVGGRAAPEGTRALAEASVSSLIAPSHVQAISMAREWGWKPRPSGAAEEKPVEQRQGLTLNGAARAAHLASQRQAAVRPARKGEGHGDWRNGAGARGGARLAVAPQREQEAPSLHAHPSWLPRWAGG